MSAFAICCDDIIVRHGASKVAVSNISLSIDPGEQVALIGPSGAGKTTLLSVLGAARQPQGGVLRLGDQNPWLLNGLEMRRKRRRLFIAPQVPPLPPRQRVVTAVMAGQLPNWSLARAIKALWYSSDAAVAHEALAQFSLQDKLWSRVDRLSGGERQRVSLARGLVSSADVLLVDEPLSALDPALSVQTLRVLIDHAKAKGSTLICSLHQVDLALAHFPRIVGLRDGELMFDLPTEQVTRDAVKELYFGRESSSLGSAKIHPMAPGNSATGSPNEPSTIRNRCV